MNGVTRRSRLQTSTFRAVASGILAFGVAFLWASTRPLGHTDLWGHVAYGRHIAEHGIPEAEPLLPLSHGEAMSNSDWLWKRLSFAVAETLDVPGLLLLQTVPVAIAAAFLAAAAAGRTRSLTGAAVGVVACWWMLKSHLMVRPQTAGLAFFCCCVWLAGQRLTATTLCGTAVAFATWANVHGSWILGVLLFLGLATGDAVTAFLRRRSVTRRASVRSAYRNAVYAAAGSAAVIANPDTFAIYGDSLTLSSHPNITSFIEWKPLSDTPRQRFAVVCCLVAALGGAVALRGRRRRVRTWTVVLPLLGQTFRVSRFVVWLAPMLALALAEVFADGMRTTRPATHRWRWTASISAVLIGCGAAGVGLASIVNVEASIDDVRSLATVVDRQTPVNAITTVNDRNLSGLIFCDQDWGDAVLMFCPKARPLVNSHGHLSPRNVWRVALGLPRSRQPARHLARIGVTIVMTRTSRTGFIDRLVRDGWTVIHRDGLATLLVADLRGRPDF